MKSRWIELAQMMGAMLLVLAAVLACGKSSGGSGSSSSTATQKLGDTVSFDDSDWIVVDAKDLGKKVSTARACGTGLIRRTNPSKASSPMDQSRGCSLVRSYWPFCDSPQYTAPSLATINLHFPLASNDGMRCITVDSSGTGARLICTKDSWWMAAIQERMESPPVTGRAFRKPLDAES